MFIKYIKLMGYTRLTQNGMSGIELNFTKVMQLILGSNGSGKSSLLEQLSLLPAIPADFEKDGYKEIHVVDGEDEYIAISDFSKGGHFLSKNGEVLNNWGTAQVQKVLVEDHVGLTQDFFDVMCNAKKFTYMSPIDRRDWVMRLSNIDIEPLMRKFELIKSRQKDAKIYLTRTSDRMKIEEKFLIGPEKLKELNEQLAELTKELEFYSKFSEEEVSIEGLDLNALSLEIQDRMDNVMALYPMIPNWLIHAGVKNPDQLRYTLAMYNERLQGKRTEYSNALKNLEEINKVAKAKAELEQIGIGDIETKIESLEKQLNVIGEDLSNYGYDKLPDNPHIATTDFTRVMTDLADQLFNLPDNSDYLYNSKALETANATCFGMESRRADLKERIFAREHQITHIDNAEEVVCPSCSYSYKRGVNANDRDRLSNEVSELKKQLNDIDIEIAKIKEFISSCSDFIERIRSIYKVMELTPSNKVLWDRIKALQIYRQPTLEAVMLMEKHVKFLELCCEKSEIQEILDRERDIHSKAKINLGIVLETQDSDTAKIDNLVFQLDVEIRELEASIETINILDRKFSAIDDQIDKLVELFEVFNKEYLAEIDNDRAEFIKKAKFDILKEINLVTQELEQARVKNAIYSDIENEYEKAKKDFENYSLVAEKLSPNTGLIGKILNNTIDRFTNNLNKVINSVWTTSFKVKPCVNKKGNLDWKFPVSVENGMLRPDVSKTSTSQRDIINLGFQLIVLKHRGRTNDPLYLDELGSSMDEQHRLNMMNVLSGLTEEGICSQMFLISHFAAMHEQFANSEIAVINTKNILQLPKTYNKHVVFH